VSTRTIREARSIRRDDAFLVVGGACIVAGGLVAAVTEPLQLTHGSWAAAYLVLVGGVAQIALGFSQRALTGRETPMPVLLTELAAWNLGSALVIGGTIVGNPVIVDVGGVALVLALGVLARTVRGGAGPRWAVWTYRGVLAVLLASIPIGLVLAHVRAP
jgi:hypothetical protein